LSTLQNIIKFYRDCYQTDLKGVRIRNFVSSQCEKRFIPETNELFHQSFSGVPINSKWGREVERILFLNAKEKVLYAGTVFVKGIQNTLGKTKEALCPLYIHELDLILNDDVYFISVKDTFFNPDFIDLANSNDDTLDIKFNLLSKEAPENPFGFENHIQLKTFFEKRFPAWDINDLSYLENLDFNYRTYYKGTIKTSDNALKIYPGLMCGIFKKPQGSLGILNELNQLSAKKTNSKLLKHLFRFDVFDQQKLSKRDIYLPTTLSENQESAFYGADAYPITQIIGPPGTGKSYTISALAIDAISNNESVLIVTRNVQASRVISNIIEKQFGIKRTIIKAYNQVYKRSVISRLNKAIKIDSNRLTNPKSLAKRISKIISQIKGIEDNILDVGNNEYQWGDFYAQHQDNFFSIFIDKWYQYKKRKTEPIWTLNNRLKELRKEKARLVKKYIKGKIQYELNTLVQKKQKEFLKLNEALKESNLTSLDEKIKQVDYELVLKALPLWTSTTKEISKCLPLVNGLFDIVIFDEASQCDLASAIPTIYRAKRMIVVGDPHQLRHISFLSTKKQFELMRDNSVSIKVADYRSESLIDWTNIILVNPDQTTYLDEHFRSKTELIQFSNHKFYDSQLKLIRSNPIADKQNALQIIPTNGSRDAKGVNKVEIQRLIETLKTIIKEQAQSNGSIISSIGISSPFTDQVKQLKKKLSEAIPFDQIKRHDILVGTPFHFRGEERDIMLISFCIDQEAHPASINYLNREDVFNVLITRARNRQIVFISVRSSTLPTRSLLKEYLEFNTSPFINESQSVIYDSFFNEVYEFLDAVGFELIKQSTMVSGILMDMVVLHAGKFYCIDLIGYPGEYEDQFSLEDLRILSRVDVPIFFLPYSSWHLEKEETQKDLLNYLQ